MDCAEEGENWTDYEIAKALLLSPSTVRNTRKIMVEERLENTLKNEIPRIAGRKRIIQGEEEAYLVALVYSEALEGHCKCCVY